MDIVDHVKVQHIFFYAMHLPYLKIKILIANSHFGFYGFKGFFYGFLFQKLLIYYMLWMNCMCNFFLNVFSFLAIYGFNSSSLQNVSIIGVKLNIPLKY
jgi:hypothetical protein